MTDVIWATDLKLTDNAVQQFIKSEHIPPYALMQKHTFSLFQNNKETDFSGEDWDFTQMGKIKLRFQEPKNKKGKAKK